MGPIVRSIQDSVWEHAQSKMSAENVSAMLVELKYTYAHDASNDAWGGPLLHYWAHALFQRVDGSYDRVNMKVPGSVPPYSGAILQYIQWAKKTNNA